MSVYVLHGLHPGLEREFYGAGVILVLNSADQVRRWNLQGKLVGKRLQAAIQFDTGMARFGMSLDDPNTLSTRDWLWIEPSLLVSHLVVQRYDVWLAAVSELMAPHVTGATETCLHFIKDDKAARFSSHDDCTAYAFARHIRQPFIGENWTEQHPG